MRGWCQGSNLPFLIEERHGASSYFISSFVLGTLSFDYSAFHTSGGSGSRICALSSLCPRTRRETIFLDPRVKGLFLSVVSGASVAREDWEKVILFWGQENSRQMWQ